MGASLLGLAKSIYYNITSANLLWSAHFHGIKKHPSKKVKLTEKSVTFLL